MPKRHAGESRTFGKGLVQDVEPLPYDSSLKLTVARYFTPSGRCIQVRARAHPNPIARARTTRARTRKTPQAVEYGRAADAGGGAGKRSLARSERTAQQSAESRPASDPWEPIIIEKPHTRDFFFWDIHFFFRAACVCARARVCCACVCARARARRVACARA